MTESLNVCVRKENIATWKRERHSALYLVWGCWCGFWFVELVQMWASWVNCFHYNEIMENINCNFADFHIWYQLPFMLYSTPLTLYTGANINAKVVVFIPFLVCLYFCVSLSMIALKHLSSPVCETGFFLWVSILSPLYGTTWHLFKELHLFTFTILLLLWLQL